MVTLPLLPDRTPRPPPGVDERRATEREPLRPVGCGTDPLAWAHGVWNDRDTWLRTRGGVESVFMAAQVLGCREEAVRWLRDRTRL
jgi:hypothetical protein